MDSGHRAVQGPENEALLFPEEDRRQFPVMDSYFTEMYTYLWLSGRTLHQVYEDGDCPAGLEEWVESGGETEHDRRVDWFGRTATEEFTERTDLFPDQEPIGDHTPPEEYIAN